MASPAQIFCPCCEHFFDLACAIPLLLNGVGIVLKGFDHFFIVTVLPGGHLLTGLIQCFAARKIQRHHGFASTVQVGVDAHGFRADLFGEWSWSNAGNGFASGTPIRWYGNGNGGDPLSAGAYYYVVDYTSTCGDIQSGSAEGMLEIIRE